MNRILQEQPAVGSAAAAWLEELRATATLALPMIVTQLGQVAIAATDTVMIGWLGPGPLAASSAANSLYFMVLIAGMGVLSVTGSLVAQARGRGDPRGVRRSLRQGLWVAGTFVLPSMLLLSQSERLLLLLGQEPAVARLAATYLDVMLWTLPWSLAFVVLRNFLAGLSRPRAALAVTLIGVPSNALLNYGLIFGNFGLPAWGLPGAAASSLVNTAAMCLSLTAFVLLDRRLKRYYILARFWRPDWPRYRQFLRLGVPAAGILLAEIGLFSTATVMMGWIGPHALAAHAVAISCASVTFMVPAGIGQAGMVRIGLAFGSGQAAGQVRAGWTALALGSLFMLLAAAVFLLMPELLVGLYLASDNPDNQPARELAVALLAVGALFQLVDGGQVVLSSLLRGVSDTRKPMLLALLGYWAIGLPVTYALAFPLGLGASGIWLGLAFGLAVVFVLLLARFRRHLRLAARGLS